MTIQDVERVRPKHGLHPARLLVLGFAALIAAGGILLWLPFSSAPGHQTSLLTALFTATSAVCVTGLTVVTTATHWSTFGQVVIMILMQMGGLGVMTISAAIYVLLGLRIRYGQRLAMQEGLNVMEPSGIVRLALQILLLTASFEAVGAVLLTIGFWPRYHAYAIFMGIFHAISAFNNAGFDLTGSSLIAYQQNPLVIFVHAGLIVFGGLGYGVLLDLGAHLRKRRTPWSLHTRWVLLATATLIAVGTVLILAIDWSDPGTIGHLAWPAKVMNALFQAITARTAGFNTVNTALMNPTALFVLLILMFIGASPGSTGGGIKTTTFAVIFAGVYAVVRQRPDIDSNGRRISWEFFSRAVAIAVLALTIVLLVTGGVLITDHVSFLEALFETTSAFGTVGLTMGLTPHLSEVGRILIIFTMFVGRLGPLTAAVALAPQARLPAAVRYPEARIPIG